MTFHIPEKRKPHLRLKLGIWWCSDQVTCGMGPTQKNAFNDWNSKRKLIESMHSNSILMTGYDSSKDRHGGFYCNHGST